MEYYPVIRTEILIHAGSVDEPQKHGAKLKTPDPKVTYHMYDPIYMKHPEKVNP